MDDLLILNSEETRKVYEQHKEKCLKLFRPFIHNTISMMQQMTNENSKKNLQEKSEIDKLNSVILNLQKEIESKDITIAENKEFLNKTIELYKIEKEKLIKDHESEFTKLNIEMKEVHDTKMNELREKNERNLKRKAETTLKLEQDNEMFKKRCVELNSKLAQIRDIF
jgi:hypothetical protein